MEILENLMSTISTRFGNVLPAIVGAILVIFIGFFIANMVKKLVQKLLQKTSIDETIAKKIHSPVRIDNFIAKLAYYLIVIYALIIALNLLGVDGVTEPLEAMLAKFMGFLPNVIGAGVIGFVGYMIASIISEATGFLSETLEKYGEKIGFNSGSISLSKILKQVVFIIIFIPILIVALDTLKMEAISGPASEMLGSLLDAIPMIIAAVILLTVFYIVGKFIVSFVTELLSNLGVNEMAENLGLGSILGKTKFSNLVGNVIMFFIMFTGVIAAAEKLNLGQVEVIMTSVMAIAGKVFFGLIILMAGVFISNLAVKAMSNGSNKNMTPLVRFAVIGIFLSFSLHTMGIAASIVNLAFGLTLGAIAVAFALSFGLGGREAAGKEMQRFFDNLRK